MLAEHVRLVLYVDSIWEYWTSNKLESDNISDFHKDAIDDLFGENFDFICNVPSESYYTTDTLLLRGILMFDQIGPIIFPEMVDYYKSRALYLSFRYLTLYFKRINSRFISIILNPFLFGDDASNIEFILHFLKSNITLLTEDSSKSLYNKALKKLVDLNNRYIVIEVPKYRVYIPSIIIKMYKEYRNKYVYEPSQIFTNIDLNGDISDLIYVYDGSSKSWVESLFLENYCYKHNIKFNCRYFSEKKYTLPGLNDPKNILEDSLNLLLKRDI